MIKNKENAIKVVNEFIGNRIELEKWYQDIKPYLKAIVLYGSVAKGTNRKDSDIDVLFVLPIEIEKKYTEGEYFYKYKGREINIVIRSIEKLRKISNEKYNLFQAEIFYKSEIIWQKDDEINKLLNKIKLKGGLN